MVTGIRGAPPRPPRPSGRLFWSGAMYRGGPAPSSSGGGWPQLMISIRLPFALISARTAVTKSSPAPSRVVLASSLAATASRQSSSRAASRKTAVTAAADRSATRPLPCASPTISRTRSGRATTSYRSPPTWASRAAERYRTAIVTGPARAGNGRSRTCCATSATSRTRASSRVRCSRIRAASIPNTVTPTVASSAIRTGRRATASSQKPTSYSRHPAAAVTPAASVYRAPPTAAATAGPTTSSGSSPQPAPSVSRAMKDPTEMANGTASTIHQARGRTGHPPTASTRGITAPPGGQSSLRA